MFIALIFSILFIILLFQILIKEEKKDRIKICGYIDNKFLIVKVSKKLTIIAKFQEIFAKIKFRKTQNGKIFD